MSTCIADVESVLYSIQRDILEVVIEECGGMLCGWHSFEVGVDQMSLSALGVSDEGYLNFFYLSIHSLRLFSVGYFKCFRDIACLAKMKPITEMLIVSRSINAFFCS